METQPTVCVPLEDLQRALAVLKWVADAGDPFNTGHISLNRMIQPGAAVAYRNLEPIERAWLAEHPEDDETGDTDNG